jgi:ribosomal protein S3
MGQKTNPTGLRLGVYRKWKSNWFVDILNYGDFLHLNFEINKYFAGILRNNAIKTFFSHCIVAKYSLEKIYIFVFIYRFRKRKKKQKVNFSKNSIQYSLPAIQNVQTLTSTKLVKLINIYGNFKLTDSKINVGITKPVNKLILKPSPVVDKFKAQRGKYTSLKQMETSLEYFLGTKVELTFINILSFIKFYLTLIKNPDYLIALEKQIINFYRYDIKLLRDAVNLTYGALLLKQPQTLANFIAYQLRCTPRNRRQSKLVQFYKKILSLMIAQFNDIIGLRIKFKGRLNGRRRTITNIINFGRLPLQQQNCYIEYGYADALTVYGTIGIKVWIFYKRDYNNYLQNNLLKYFFFTTNKK